MVLVVYFFFIYLDDEGCEWMMVVVWKVREIILKIKKIWHFNEMKCKIDNLMWMFWKVYVQAKLRKDEGLYFFFFWETTPGKKGGGEIHYYKLDKYTNAISEGMSSIQTWKWEKLEADLASLWATLFPSLRVWLKDKLLKAAMKDLISLMMCPKLEDSHPSLDNALMVIFESPSKII